MSIAVDTGLEALTEGFSEESRVRYLVVDEERRRLTADFDRMMLSSDPDSSVRLMALTATNLLLSLDADERVQVEEFLA